MAPCAKNVWQMDIMVDSSIWINFFNNYKSKEADELQKFHKDQDFELIAKETKLKIHKL
ncbi:hypothetical protein AGMMS50233_06470 [Endomicrobiia bacterium]|nr:hypothetical protein AGMMS50233_06470 [Endomicrobiia bacterium]